MKAVLRNFRQSPRKMRLVTDAVRGKSIEEALAILPLITKRATVPLAKLLRSALSNAKAISGASAEDLYIKSVRVDKGVVLRRSRPRSRGMANPIKKRSSHIVVELENRGEVKTKKARAPKKAKTTKKEEK